MLAGPVAIKIPAILSTYAHSRAPMLLRYNTVLDSSARHDTATLQAVGL